MVLEPGNHLLIVHRRLFEADHSRFFVGRVEGYDSGVARVSGYSFGRDHLNSKFIRKPDLRTKLIGIGSGTLIIYCLPNDISLEVVVFDVTESGLKLVCPPDVSLNLSEYFHQH